MTAGLVVLAVLALLLLAALALYLNRREAARDVLVGWLDRRGVQSDVEVERIDLDGFVARVRIGDPTDPDVTVERVEVDYAVGLPWSAAGLGVNPTRIRLVQPVVRARWADGRLSLGSLDPIIDDFRSRPPRPDATAPIVIVERGRLNLASDYGAATVFADARLEDGRLMRLSARMPAADLRDGENTARIQQAALEVTTTGERTVFGLGVRADRLASGDTAVEGARLTLGGAGPYPDFDARRTEGGLWLNALLQARTITGDALDASALDARAAFRGQGAGWIDALRLTGRGDVDVRADRLQTSAVSLGDARFRQTDAAVEASRGSRGLLWRLDGAGSLDAGALTLAGMDFTGVRATSRRLVSGGRNSAFEVVGPLALTADRFDFDALTLRGVSGNLQADVVSDGLFRTMLTGSLSARSGAWPLFGPTASDDLAELAEIKRALSAFGVSAPGVRIATGAEGTRVDLTAPARLTPVNGGVLTVSPAARPVFLSPPGQPGGGAFTFTATRGRGLPQMRFDVPDWRLTGDGFQARLDGEAALDFAFMRGLSVDTVGLLASGGGVLTYRPNGCSPVTAEMFELGENDALDVSGTLCPLNGSPLLSVRDGRWRVAASMVEAAATVPFLALRATGGAGRLDVQGGPAGVDLTVDAERITLTDTTEPARFNPLIASGRATLEAEDWTGRLDLSASGYRLGVIDIRHDGQSGAGGVAIDATGLQFAPGGLQPAMITPLVETLVQPPVTGRVDFTGRFDWTEGAEPTSSGLLVIPELDFVSPLGPVTGLDGTVAFDSLTPLIAAPGQRLNIDRIDAFAPLTDVNIDFGLDASAVTVSGAEVAVGGGVIRIEPFSLPLTPDTAWDGVLVLERVQLGDLVAGTGFRDKVMLDAVVSGRLPFRMDGQGKITITGGDLAAVAPGRLSIQREALSGLEAGGGGAEVPPNVVQDLAYQAMENLSFTTLTAQVNSAPNGRLAILFHIIGEHRPPVPQELRLTLQELLNRDFLNRELPLPSGTAIDLTLDTTINLDQLLSDFAAIQRARAGQPEPTP